MSKRTKKFAAVTAVTATAAALTVGAAAPSPDKQITWRDVLLTAGPDFFQLIEDMSSSLDNIIIAQGNINEGFESFWDPISSASGGLLPSFDSEYENTDLTTLSGILEALASALQDGTNVEAVPGIPAGSATTVLALLLGGLGVDIGPLESVLDSLGGLNTVLGSAGDVLKLLEGLEAIGLLDDLVDISELLGLTANQSSLSQTWTWLGLTQQTNVGNTYVNLDQLTLSGLLGNLGNVLDLGSLDGALGLGGLLNGIVANLGDLGLDLDDLGQLDNLLSGLDIIATPEVTAWIPAASGTYELPFGGSAGFLAAMPTIAIGSIQSLVDEGVLDLSDLDPLLEELNADGLVDLDSATVIAVPILAAGTELPLGLADYGVVNASVLLPTATGVTQLGGTTLQTLNIPLLSTNVLYINALQASYVGTNGFSYNSGQTALTITTPLGALPLVYSMGAVNAGTSGVGVTLPSLFGVGLVPSFQIGTPVGQESSDGLIGRDVLNAGLNLPTQTTNVATLVGLGGVFDPAESAGTAVWNTAVKPVGDQVKNYLNDNVGEWVNGAASQFEALTGQVADATGGDQSATSSMALTSSKTSANTSSEGSTTTGTSSTPSLTDLDDLTNVSANLTDALTNASAQFKTSAASAQAKTEAAVKSAQTQLNKIAADGQKAIKNVTDGVKKAVNDTVNGVKKAADDAAKKTEKAAG